MKSLQTWVREDHKIEADVSDVTLRLMEHRWNACQAFSIREYARALGRHDTGVRNYVRGWELWQEELLRVPSARRSPSEIVELAKFSVERRTATEAVAEAKGISIQQARKQYKPEVKRVEQSMRDHIERREKATPAAKARMPEPAEHARKVAEQTERTRHQAEQSRKNRRAHKTKAFLDLETELDKARRALTNALVIARDADVDDEFIEFVSDSLGNIRTVLSLIDMAVTGSLEVDWDAEMRKLGSL